MVFALDIIFTIHKHHLDDIVCYIQILIPYNINISQRKPVILQLTCVCS